MHRASLSRTFSLSSLAIVLSPWVFLLVIDLLVSICGAAGLGLVSAFSPNLTFLVILCGFVGIGLGCGPVLSSWFLEFIPAPKRGAWMEVFSAFWTIGTILEASM